jgi:hypothetical protein
MRSYGFKSWWPSRPGRICKKLAVMENTKKTINIRHALKMSYWLYLRLPGRTGPVLVGGTHIWCCSVLSYVQLNVLRAGHQQVNDLFQCFPVSVHAATAGAHELTTMRQHVALCRTEKEATTAGSLKLGFLVLAVLLSSPHSTETPPLALWRDVVSAG